MSTATTPTRTRREMLTLIAGADDLPTPRAVHFLADILSLTMETLHDGLAWSQCLGGDTGTYVNRDGYRYLDEGRILWHGWVVQLHANVRAGLDTTNRAASAVVPGGAA